jgi:hypothetical protein
MMQRRRCNTLEETDGRECNLSANRDRGPTKYINIVTPDIVSSNHDLLIFEDEARARTSTLESVMAVQSLSSDQHHLNQPTVPDQSQDWTMNMDDKSDVSSLSDYEHSHHPQPPTRPLLHLSSLFKRKSQSRSTETATTAMHTLETIDNFDVCSPFSPLGALSGREELSFFKSAEKRGEEEYASLHGYHRRCRTSHKSEGGFEGLVRNYSDQLSSIQNSWLVPGNNKGGEPDLIDMEHEVDELKAPSTPSHVTTSSASVTSASVSSPMKSFDITTSMSTGGSEYSNKGSRPLTKPPLVSRAITDPTSRILRTTFHPQRHPQSNIDSPCMIGSTIAEAISPKAISFPRRPSFTNYDAASLSMSINTKEPSLPSLEEDDENASFGSFDEELRRKDKVASIRREMKQLFKNLDPKPVVKKGRRLLGLNVNEDGLMKRADGCLT